MKDKNPKFNEVAHSKHTKGSDDLMMEAPRFVTQNRLDNVISKVEIGATAATLTQLLSEDALSDMQKKEQFMHAFAEQTESDLQEVKKTLTLHSATLVSRYSVTVLDKCIVCNGSGELLRTILCPLCWTGRVLRMRVHGDRDRA